MAVIKVWWQIYVFCVRPKQCEYLLRGRATRRKLLYVKNNSEELKEGIEVLLKTIQIVGQTLPLVTGQYISFLKHLSSGGRIQSTAKYMQRTELNQSQEPFHRILIYEKRIIQLNALLIDTSVMIVIQTKSLMTKPSELESDALNHSAMKLKFPPFQGHYQNMTLHLNPSLFKPILV